MKPQPATSRPRVLLVSATTFYGGGEVHYVKLAGLLMERYEVAAIVCNGTLAEELARLGIFVWHGDLSNLTARRAKYWAVMRLLVQTLRNYKPSVVHLNGGPEVFLATIPNEFRIPVLITYHTCTNADIPFLKRRLLSRSLRSAQKVICVSKTVQRNLHDVLGVTNTTVIPNWLQQFPERVAPVAPERNRPLNLLYVGRIEPAKGVFDLLHAMRNLKDVHLHLVGDGASMAEAIEMGHGMPLTFHGFQENVFPFYERADFLVLPSWSEGQPLVLLEAMGAGLPCIVSDIPSILEVTDNGRVVLTHKVHDVSDLTRVIASGQKDPGQALDLARAAAEHTRQFHSVECVRPMVYGIFETVLTGAGSSPQ
jgi:glycosyltransferase involved in cell wall biosynthesis